MSIIIKAVFANNKLRNYQYLLMSKVNACIDPFDGEQVVSAVGQNQKIDILLNTHQHYDHIKGNDKVLAQGASLFGRSKNKIQLNENDYLERIPTPGHTLDSDSLMLFERGELQAIFVGDTLFVGGVGNCYNGGDAAILARSLIELDQRLKTTTKIYPGHDYWENNKNFVLEYYGDYLELSRAIELRESKSSEVNTSWGDEKAHNPFLRVLFDESFRQMFFPDTARVEAFCQMRRIRDKY